MLWFVCPDFADGFVWREALEGLQSSAEVIGLDEVGEVTADLVVGVVVEALDGRLLEGPVQTFDLTVGPGMAWFGKAVIDLVLGTGVFEGVHPDMLALIHGPADVGCCGAGVPR